MSLRTRGSKMEDGAEGKALSAEAKRKKKAGSEQ